MPRKLELERALETRCVERIEALGGLALKLLIPGVRGFPDRTILLPGTRSPAYGIVTGKGRVFFAEFKRLKSGRVSAQQHRWRVLLHQLGFGVYTIDTDEQFEDALKRELAK